MTHELMPTSLPGVDDNQRGAAVRARREHVGMSASGLAKMAGVDRGKLRAFEEGEDTPSERWIASVERALDRFEAETGHQPGEAAKAAEAGFVRIRLEGVPGATGIVMEAAPENIEELVEAVARILRQNREGDTPTTEG